MERPPNQNRYYQNIEHHLLYVLNCLDGYWSYGVERDDGMILCINNLGKQVQEKAQNIVDKYDSIK